MNKTLSLAARIKAAKTSDEIQLLLSEGARFEYAAPKTQRRWKRLATQRHASLSAKPSPSTSASATTPAPKKVSAKKNFKKKS